MLPWNHVELAILYLARGAAGFALNWALQSTLLISAGLIIGRLLWRHGAAAQSVVYRTTLVALLVCPVLSWAITRAGVPGWSLDVPPAWTNPAASLASLLRTEPPGRQVTHLKPDAGPADHVGSPSEMIASSPVRTFAADAERDGRPMASVPVAPAPVAVAALVTDDTPEIDVEAPDSQVLIHAFGWLAIGLSAVWLSVSSWLLARLALACWRLTAIRRRARAAETETICLCRELSAKLGVTTPEVLHTPFLPSPCLAGLRHPAILLPEAGLCLALRDVLIHELAHLSRQDCHWNLLRKLATALFFFQPLLWLLSRRLDMAAEEVCDDYVVHLGGDRTEYANRLLDVAELSTAPMASAGVGIVSLRSMLARRIARIMDTSRHMSTSASRALLLCTLAGGLIGTAIIGFVGAAPARPAISNTKSGSAPEESGVKGLALAEDPPARPVDAGKAKSDLPEQAAPPAEEQSGNADMSYSKKLALRVHGDAKAMDKLPRFYYRMQTVTGDVETMRDMDECTLDGLIKALDAPIDRQSMQQGTETLAWTARQALWNSTVPEMPRLAVPSARDLASNLPGQNRKDMELKPRTFRKDRIWTKEVDFERYESDGRPPFFVFILGPEYKNLGYVRVTPHQFWWPLGNELRNTISPAAPEQASYQFVGRMKFDGELCDLVQSTTRAERLWIGHESKRLRGVLKFASVRRGAASKVPFHKMEIVEKRAGRKFATADDYHAWIKSRSQQQKSDFFRGFAGDLNDDGFASHRPAELLRFRDYREVAPGVWIPFHEDHALTRPVGNTPMHHQYLHCGVDVQEVKTDFDLSEIVKRSQPKVGDKILDRRFENALSYHFHPDKRTKEQILALVADERIKKGPINVEDSIRLILDTTVDVNLVNTPLKNALGLLHEEQALHMWLNKAAIARAGVTTDTRITLSLSGVTVANALERILDPLKLAYLIEDDVLKITTPEDAEARLKARVQRDAGGGDIVEKKASMPPPSRTIDKSLDAPVDLPFIETPLNEVLKFLKKQQGIDIRLDEATIKAAGLPIDTPITLSLAGVRLRSALNLILEPLKLTYVSEGGALIITTVADAAERLKKGRKELNRPPARDEDRNEGAAKQSALREDEQAAKADSRYADAKAIAVRVRAAAKAMDKLPKFYDRVKAGNGDVDAMRDIAECSLEGLIKSLDVPLGGKNWLEFNETLAWTGEHALWERSPLSSQMH